MTTNAQLSIDVRIGVVIVRQAGKVIRRIDRDQTGVVTVNLADHPAAEAPDTAPWTPFEEQPTPPVLDPSTGQLVDLGEGGPVRTYANSLYTVMVRPLGDDGATHLSIRANDRNWRHDWRHLQRIKDELLGPEVEAVELYPASSRLVDQANQFHLWAMPPGLQFPVGFPARIDTTLPAGGFRQRPPTSGVS